MGRAWGVPFNILKAQKNLNPPSKNNTGSNVSSPEVENHGFVRSQTWLLLIHRASPDLSLTVRAE